ncbi:hypothetical protein HYDPIDRAFT_182431 [Hydnomerulius pinastri MD-312]|uniref:tRNA-guanine(15) transglycosylase-like domain-containing protein n=1 Tax=Hydnomerulius pinastri MD-312 TaxID=994086 RepID=A0A0C9W7F7_9AGAM|nr:hypothetical protein HYDPIDRAFT_182431 [Hydnomerulius pinastri MD-312]
MAQQTDPHPPSADFAMRLPLLTFVLSSTLPQLGPRLGKLVLTRPTRKLDETPSSSDTTVLEMETPNILVGTSRGIVPHLSRDHCNSSDAIKWINVPFESFLEQVPPIPTMQPGPYPLHSFLGFDTRKHITSLCLRDPLDSREMPPNGNAAVSANCVRGVRKVTLPDWRSYVSKMQPDIVFALTDTPFTTPPHSQKRVTKSIERSAAWVSDILRPISESTSSPQLSTARISQHPLNVFVHMAGGTSTHAREAFAYSLTEKLHGPEAEAVKPLQTLDEGISGYSFDLASLRGIKPSPNTSQHRSLPDDYLQRESPDMLQNTQSIEEVSTPNTTGGLSLSSSVSSLAEPIIPLEVSSLLKASLEELPKRKPRLVTGVRSPHEMLRLIRDVGVDVFDSAWAMNAANIGIALDFVFPVPCTQTADTKPRNLGHNIYHSTYAHQFTRLADSLSGAAETPQESGPWPRIVCPCIACSPQSPFSHVLHSSTDVQSYSDTSNEVVYGKPCSRAYLHHLLHTHEMSAHTLLVAHNLAVLSALLSGVRAVLNGGEGVNERFADEVKRFEDTYDESMEVFSAAKKDWRNVDKARGKGRLAREKGRQEDEEVG